ncbi:glycosyltransferase family 4 protein [Paenibacillus abyssi]|uniref:Glycosyl transferase family 1 n=1 Tax=Paenibacillus abyssi TaxID=1340531 RepID=A0A917FR75_9BACL|nr:glycosyltransferase family 4 protein [Paenibacillus abyssi]GGF98885.1 hypothetical protein GCM10010916_15190 [Paenibacillus abyssi]
MAMPKVAFVTPGSFPLPSSKSSSVERVVEYIVPQLNHVVRARIYGRTAPRLARRGTLHGVTCLRFPAVNKIRYIQSVARSLRTFRPDLVVVENRPQHLLRIRKQCPRSRIWLNLHSTTFIGNGYISPKLLRESLRCAERIIVNSMYLRNVVAAKVPDALHKLRVVHLGVETSKFHSQYSVEGAERRHWLRHIRGWKDRSVVLYMGRLIPRKGVHHLLSLLPELVAVHPDILIVIVGSAYYGSHRITAYTRQLHRLGKAWPNHVLFVPYVPYNEVPDWYLAADAAVVPSDRREAFGLVNVEAMACGLPVVATRAGGMKEIIEDGVTGLLADPDHLRSELRDCILLLLQDNELRAMMGQRSRERVERYFNWQKAGERWMEVFMETGLLNP